MNRVNFTLANLLLGGIALYILVFAFWYFRHMLKHHTPDERKKKVRRNFILVVAGYMAWVGVLSLLAVNGFFDEKTLPPRFILFFIAMVCVSLVLCTLSIHKHLSFLKQGPSHCIIYFHSFRSIVEIALWLLYLENMVPKEMTFEGRNLDVLVGLIAPLAAFLVRSKNQYATGIVFNILGLLALLNIASIVVLSFPSPFQQYDTLKLASYFPGIVVPAMLAPVATYAHIISIRQLLWKYREQKLLFANTAI